MAYVFNKDSTARANSATSANVRRAMGLYQWHPTNASFSEATGHLRKQPDTHSGGNSSHAGRL